MRLAVLSLGSNLGDREKHLAAMGRALRKVLRPPFRASRLMETEPVDVAGPQPWYLNRVVSGGFGGTCRELLDRCHEIEARLGRERRGNRAPRTADIDILLFGGETVSEGDLTVPHPALRRRRFLLEGLAEIHADLRVLGTGATAEELLGRMDRAVSGQGVRFRGRGNGIRE